ELRYVIRFWSLCHRLQLFDFDRRGLRLGRFDFLKRKLLSRKNKRRHGGRLGLRRVGRWWFWGGLGDLQLRRQSRHFHRPGRRGHRVSQDFATAAAQRGDERQSRLGLIVFPEFIHLIDLVIE